MPAATKLWVFKGLNDIAISIDKVNRSSEANRSALWIYKNFRISQGSREEPGYVMGDEALTLSLIRSDEYVRE